MLIAADSVSFAMHSSSSSVEFEGDTAEEPEIEAVVVVV